MKKIFAFLLLISLSGKSLWSIEDQAIHIAEVMQRGYLEEIKKVINKDNINIQYHRDSRLLTPLHEVMLQYNNPEAIHILEHLLSILPPQYNTSWCDTPMFLLLDQIQSIKDEETQKIENFHSFFDIYISKRNLIWHSLTENLTNGMKYNTLSELKNHNSVLAKTIVAKIEALQKMSAITINQDMSYYVDLAIQHGILNAQFCNTYLLHRLNHPDLISLALEKGANPNSVDVRHLTALAKNIALATNQSQHSVNYYCKLIIPLLPVTNLLIKGQFFDLTNNNSYPSLHNSFVEMDPCQYLIYCYENSHNKATAKQLFRLFMHYDKRIMNFCLRNEIFDRETILNDIGLQFKSSIDQNIFLQTIKKQQSEQKKKAHEELDSYPHMQSLTLEEKTPLQKPVNIIYTFKAAQLGIGRIKKS